MKNILLAFAVLLIALLSQCKKFDMLWKYNLGKAFAVQPAQQYEEETNSGGLRITFESVVSETRCPAFMFCILPGWVDVALKFQVGDETRFDTLSIPAGSGLQRPSSATFKGYKIELQEVAPLPPSFDPIPRADYRLKLLVTK